MSGIEDLYKKIPTHMRLYAEYMLGDDSKITEKDFTQEELAYLKRQIEASYREQVENQKAYEQQMKEWEKTGGKSDDWQRIEYTPEGEEIVSYTKDIPEYFNPPNTKKQVIGYEKYRENPNEEVRNSLGMYVANRDPETGATRVVDGYNFNKEENEHFGLEKEPGLMGLIQILKNKGQLRNIPEILARVLRPEGHRDVEINLDTEMPENYREGGRVKLI